MRHVRREKMPLIEQDESIEGLDLKAPGQTVTRKNFNFTELPPELRTQIYCFLDYGKAFFHIPPASEVKLWIEGHL